MDLETSENTGLKDKFRVTLAEGDFIAYADQYDKLVIGIIIKITAETFRYVTGDESHTYTHIARTPTEVIQINNIITEQYKTMLRRKINVG